MEQLHFKEIEKYVNGLMSDAEQAAFRQRLSEDASLAREYALSREIDQFIGDSRVANFNQALDKAHKSFKRRKSAKILYRVAASIMFLLVAGGGILLLQPPQSGVERVITNHYESYQPLSGMRSAGASSVSELKAAYEAFNTRDYALCGQLLENILKNNPANQQARFFLAMTYLESGQPGKAESYFLECVESKDVVFAKLSDYYLGFSYLKAGIIEKAITQFEKTAAREGAYQEKARAILKDLKKF